MKSNTCISPLYCPNPSKHEVKLYRKLKDLGIESQLKYWDGMKTIDIAILWAKLSVQIVDDNGVAGNQSSETDFLKEDQSDPELIQTLIIHDREIKEDANRVAHYIARHAKTRFEHIRQS